MASSSKSSEWSGTSFFQLRVLWERCEVLGSSFSSSFRGSMGTFHSPNGLNWNLKKAPLKMTVSFEGLYFRFHGCSAACKIVNPISYVAFDMLSTVPQSLSSPSSLIRLFLFERIPRKVSGNQGEASAAQCLLETSSPSLRSKKKLGPLVYIFTGPNGKGCQLMKRLF